MSYQVKSLVFAPNLARISVKFNQAIHTPLNKQLLKVISLKQGNLRQQVRRPSGYYEISASASFIITLESGIDVGQGITVGPGKFVKKNKRE